MMYIPDFIVFATDNASPQSEITLGIRKKCTGNGFPDGKTSLIFTPNEIGDAYVELWAKDLAGNTATCISQVYVSGTGSCDPGSGIYISSPKDSTSAIKGVVADIYKVTCQGDSSQKNVPVPDGGFLILSIPGELLKITYRR